jgi:probable HAF family extracellular repeat protein
VSADGSVIVGNYNGDQAFIWRKATGLRPLTGDGGVTMHAYTPSISNDGQIVVGTDGRTLSTPRAFQWTAQGGYHLIPGLGISSNANAVSNNGLVVGVFSTGPGKNHAFIWDSSSGLNDLGAMEALGGLSAVATGITANGSTVVGEYVDSNEVAHAFIWTKAKGANELTVPDWIDIHTLGISGNGTTVLFKSFTNPQHNVIAYFTMSLSGQPTDAYRSSSTSEALSAEEETRYKRIFTSGRPAQIYAFAGDMADQRRFDLADKLYQLLIDKFPDDPYTSKAIDKREALKGTATSQQQKIQQQSATPVAVDSQRQEATVKAQQQAEQQRLELAYDQCKAKADQCSSQCEVAVGDTLAGSIAGALMHNGNVSALNQLNQNSQAACSQCDAMATQCESMRSN